MSDKEGKATRAVLLLLALMPLLFASKGLTASDVAWLISLKTFVTDVFLGGLLYFLSSFVASATGVALPTDPVVYFGLVLGVALVHMLIELILFAIAALLYKVLFG